MSEHPLETRFLPADPNDPETVVASERMRYRRPLEPDEYVASERVDILERVAGVEDVDENAIGLVVDRRHVVTRHVKRRT